MKKAVHVLHREHELIERAANCLERIADRTVARDEFDVGGALDVLEFLVHCANGTHQRKEEQVLFPALLAQGVATHRIGELLAEHVAEREALDQMQLLIEGAAYGEASSRDRFIWLAQRYARAQIDHARKEELTLLPIAEEFLEEESNEELLKAFREIDVSDSTHSLDEYAEILESIVARLDSAPTADARPEESLATSA